MRDAIRSAIVSDILPAFAAANPGVPIVFDNDPFDWANPPAAFLSVEVEFQSGSQIGMAASSQKTRLRGHVYVNAYSRLGTGVKVAQVAGDWVADHLKYRTIGDVQLQAPDPDGHSEVRGYRIDPIKVAFFSTPT